MSNIRNRTPTEYIGHGLYFLGLSLRNVVKALSYLHLVKRSHVLFAKKWKWIQKFRHRRISSTKRNKYQSTLQMKPYYMLDPNTSSYW